MTGRKHRIFRGLALLLALALLTGCGQETVISQSGNDLENEITGPYEVSKKEGATVLTLGTLVPDTQVLELVSRFNQSHDDYQIEIKTYYDEYASDLYASIDRMNLEMVSGETPDILFLDSLDVKNFENVGLLMDLTQYLEADGFLDNAAYFADIWRLFSYKGGIYECIPCFWIEGIVGPASLLGDEPGWTIAEYQALQTEEGTLLSADYELMSAYMTRFALGDFLDVERGTCDFTSEEFFEWLEFVNCFPDKAGDSCILRCGTIQDMITYADYCTQYGDVAIKGYPGAAEGSACAVSMYSYGISAKTEYPEICWEFCRMMLSEAVQRESFSGYGIPMNRAAYQEQLAAAMLPAEDENSMFYGQEDILPLTQENADALNRCLDTVSQTALRYDDIQDVITEELEAYHAGDKTAEETAEIIQNRVKIYLSEQA